jgi:hypothetical protein
VKTESLDWLADNPFFTKRFAFFVGRRCRDSSVKAVAEELFLDWHTVKELDKQYMGEQLRRAGQPAPKAIGIDEIAIGRGHSYRIVVSDLIRGRPIWFGGKDRSEASMDEFYVWLGPAKSSKIRLAVMDMWKAFRISTLKKGNAPQALIVYDKFHVLRHLQDALDTVRKNEYARLTGAGPPFYKGPKVCLVVTLEKSFPGGEKRVEDSIQRQPATIHGLPSQGIFRTTMELRIPDLGPTLLFQLAGVPPMATAQALREIRHHDRKALGRHRGLLPYGKQSRSRFCRGSQQQDSGDSTTRLRFPR